MKRQAETIQVLYEDNHLLALNKPAGVLVQGDQTGDPTLADWAKQYIKQRYEKPGEVFLGIIHRLDRPVSGVVFFARTSKALERMNALFRDRKIDKTYWAIVNERPQPLKGHLVHSIVKDEDRNVVKALEPGSNRAKLGKLAELDYELLAQVEGFFLLEVKPATGRPHQIRAQLAKAGFPIMGDKKYGSRYTSGDGSILLHCRTLAFEHPVKKEAVKVSSELPDHHIWRMFRHLSNEKFNT